MSTKSSRRDFVKTGLIAGVAGIAAPSIIPSKVLAKPGRRLGANDRIVLGGIGTGSRFSGLGPSFSRMDGIAFAAVADADLNRAKSSAGRVGASDAYQDYRRVLDRKDIDAVIIASPDHWHALHSIHAVMAGKDVYCEKAMTLTVEEGRRMVQAVRKYQRVLQTGSQQRSEDRFYRAIMLIRNGYIGKVTKVVGVNYAGPWENALPGQPVPDGLNWDMWMGQVEPHPYNDNVRVSRSNPGWLSIRDFCGGEICGWGAHGLDQIQWALGMDESGPVEVWVEGNPYKPWVATPKSGYGRFFGAKDPVIHYRYPGDIHVELSEDANPNGGALFIGDSGQVRVDRGRLEVSDPGWLQVPYDQMKVQVKRSENHNQNFLNAIRDRTRPIADVEIGHRSATVAHLGNIARWVSERTQTTGEVMQWDSQAERFTNNDWGNYYLSRPRRTGYELPEIA
jgi:predicted dehydrogenase